MIIQFNPDIDLMYVYKIEQLLQDYDLTVKQLIIDENIYFATSGDHRQIDYNYISSLHGIAKLIEDPPSFYFAGKEFKSSPTVVKIGNVEIGGGASPVIIAGPCAVENREDTLQTARAVKGAGASVFRGGVFKPKTSPHSYQGIGVKGLEILAEVRDVYGLPVITEVMDQDDIQIISKYCDALWVGTRNMSNSSLLKHLGKTTKPVILKRGYSSKIEELVRAAEYIIMYGNPNVILCERGIRTFETYTRNTLDLSAIPAIKEISHLPVIVDPSHGTGKTSLIPAMSKASLVAGADGLMIECHINPDKMLKPGDGFQTLRPQELDQLIKEINLLCKV